MDKIVLPPEVVKNLTEARRWYDAQPSCLKEVLGDRFHENYVEWENCELPDSVHSMFGEAYYFNRLEVADDGKLFAMFLDIDTSDEETAKWIEVVPT